MLLRQRVCASQELSTEAPSEFRIFRAGINETSKGSTLFDDEAAASVMAAWQRWGVDLMIDLEHQSLDAGAGARDDAADARGWCKLEVRNGELWAVNVQWTPDGTRRLKERTQRYVSPAFIQDEESDRVLEMLNIALCAMPATYAPQALIAASIAERIRAAASARLRASAPRVTIQLSALQRARVDSMLRKLSK